MLEEKFVSGIFDRAWISYSYWKGSFEVRGADGEWFRIKPELLLKIINDYNFMAERKRKDGYFYLVNPVQRGKNNNGK